ncbi:nuclear transport factor 2 family protein [Rheinheimera baltica]|uniref:nuclear transport factor 2 family protein n=1 Tax=Rheinheimera baltica TaxID=67576 RepID=UPI00273EB1F1|nr:nuclear transport factor 2 family protein [Rheinheimera baltica]MDP5143827.1 nuclear transport factor 2 family protein [Rheinheimera baltica]
MDSKLLTPHLIELEQLLVQPATRLSAELLNRYLADDFYEIGATGRCFGKADVLERLPTETPPVITQQDFDCRVFADWLAQLTYRATIQRADDNSPTYSVRSSIYRFDGESWQMIFTRAQFVIHFNRRKYRPMRDALRQIIIVVCDTKIRAKGEMVGVSF